MKNRVLSRKLIEKDNIITIKEEIERKIDRRDISTEIERLDRKKEKLEYMKTKLLTQIEDVTRERDGLVSIMEKEEL